MKASELRIGNFMGTHNKGEEDKVLTINAQNILTEAKSNKQGYSRYRPIPLTEEWLLKFGFEYLDSSNWFVICSDSNHLIYIYFEKVKKSFAMVYNGSQFCTIRHVYQLQNLYFALTNEELILTK